MREQVLALLPSMVLHLFIALALAGALWRLVAQSYPQHHGSWKLIMAAAASFSLFSSSSTLITLHQNQILYALQQREETGTSNRAPASIDPRLQMKADFLEAVAHLSESPTQVNAANKKELFDRFAELFQAGPEEREKYSKALLEAYNCQRYFYEDALASYKYKKVVKSDDRERCESKSGEFFNRQKLVAPEVVNNNDAAIARLAARQPLTDAAGKAVPIDETGLRQSLDSQIKRTEGLRKLFE